MASFDASSSQLPSSSHRLPTVSASQALNKLRSRPARVISSTLPRLDELLTTPATAKVPGVFTASTSGFACGTVTDIYGPPGSGKTALCLQTTTSTLVKGHAVRWIDCGTSLYVERLRELLNAFLQANTSTCGLDDQMSAIASRFHHHIVPDLAHLLALFSRPTTDFPGESTALVVIDSVSTLFDTAYSYVREDRFSKKNDNAKWAANRKFAIMSEIANRLQKIASMNNLVILLTQQTRLKVRQGAGALLMPILASAEWDNAIANQLVLFRDFAPKISTQPDPSLLERWTRLRYVGLIKANGASAEENGRFETVVPFTIEKNGLEELPPLDSSVAAPVLSSPVRTSKRRFEEIADSEDESLSDDEYPLDEDVDFESGLTELAGVS